MRDALSAWTDFHVAVAGTGGALGGLLVVALSVNVRQIAGSRGLAARAAAAIASVVLGVVLACVALVPGLSLPGFGAVVLVGAVLAGAVTAVAIRYLLVAGPDGAHDADGRGGTVGVAAEALRAGLLVLPVLAFFVGGVLLAADVRGGLVAVAIGTLTALVGAVVFSWVALVEILR
ncbi:hypothetical protein [Cellulomonas triticagri]|uniref:Modulator of FtsH protease n=1 Tax=Cellulomonas triticagri TaxID=2483352 RepID=A0A3M2J0A2_9CELL|nr:hypothetical protein [Cellulomonas triticagri]RMI04893.1 hypothetical protein EBM89_17340 [Cellulomonas triticagri]